MLYITGIQALNIEDSTECCGDWHTSAQDWSKLNIADSKDSRFKDWGIETDKFIPTHKEHYNVANTLRAVVDLLQDKKYLGYLKGFRNDFFCTDVHNQEFFEKVIMLRDIPHWNEINHLMQMEFMWDWDRFCTENKVV